MTDSTNKTKRPSSITLVSVFAIILGFDFLYFIFSPGIQNFVQDQGVWNTIIVVLGSIVFLVIGVGFWLMKKWAVYTLIAFAILVQVYLISVGRWNIFSLVILSIPVFIGYKHLSKMT